MQRATLLGGASAGAGVVSHAAVTGHVPGAFVSLAAMLVMGALAWLLATIDRSVVTHACLLAGGQVFVHAFASTSAAGHAHGVPMADTAAAGPSNTVMLAAHLVVLLVAATLLARWDQRCWQVACRLVRRVLEPFRHVDRVVSGRAPVLAACLEPRFGATPLRAPCDASRRGPPFRRPMIHCS
jgi:hypothetical protein